MSNQPTTTKCPKLGAEQWTCPLKECTCHARYSEAFVATDPHHGGKIDCVKCKSWIYGWEEFKEFDAGRWAHVKCLPKLPVMRKIAIKDWYFVYELTSPDGGVIGGGQFISNATYYTLLDQIRNVLLEECGSEDELMKRVQYIRFVNVDYEPPK